MKSMNQLYYIIAGAGIGSLFTLVVQSVTHLIKRRRLKKSLNILLQVVILPICAKLKKESETIKEHMNLDSDEDLSLGMYPALNSSIIKSYSLDQIRSAYGKNMPDVIDIISILDNLENRKPYIYFSTFTKEVESHINENFENEKHHFSSKKDHFMRCALIKQMKERVTINLEHVEVIIEHLENKIKNITN